MQLTEPFQSQLKFKPKMRQLFLPFSNLSLTNSANHFFFFFFKYSIWHIHIIFRYTQTKYFSFVLHTFYLHAILPSPTFIQSIIIIILFSQLKSQFNLLHSNVCAQNHFIIHLFPYPTKQFIHYSITFSSFNIDISHTSLALTLAFASNSTCATSVLPFMAA